MGLGQLCKTLLIGVGPLALAACGGGDISSASSVPSATPTPTPTPTPTATPSPVNIFASPTVAEYASVGASIAGAGGNLDTFKSKDDRFGTVSAQNADQPNIRYTAGGYYEIKMPGAAWDRLVFYKGAAPQDPASFNYFQPASVAQNYGFLATNNSRNSGYAYSELASWGSAAAGRWGYLAFGTPTPAGGVPLIGSATYNGVVAGAADIMEHDFLYGGYDSAPVSGTVGLTFNFSSGTLAGSMSPAIGATSLGTLSFKDIVFSAGSTTYSGSFDATVAGQNFFLGKFTGPNAQETIGAWAVPFVYSGDGQVHQAFGAWIAKKP